MNPKRAKREVSIDDCWREIFVEAIFFEGIDWNIKAKQDCFDDSDVIGYGGTGSFTVNNAVFGISLCYT